MTPYLNHVDCTSLISVGWFVLKLLELLCFFFFWPTVHQKLFTKFLMTQKHLWHISSESDDIWDCYRTTHAETDRNSNIKNFSSATKSFTNISGFIFKQKSETYSLIIPHTKYNTTIVISVTKWMILPSDLPVPFQYRWETFLFLKVSHIYFFSEDKEKCKPEEWQMSRDRKSNSLLFPFQSFFFP